MLLKKTVISFKEALALKKLVKYVMMWPFWLISLQIATGLFNNYAMESSQAVQGSS